MSKENCQRVAKSLFNTKLILDAADHSLSTKKSSSHYSVPASSSDVKSLTEAYHNKKIMQKVVGREYDKYKNFEKTKLG